MTPTPVKAASSAALPFKAIILATLIGGLVSALVGFVTGHKDWGLGAFVGALLSSIGLLGLKASLRRMLSPEQTLSKGMFMAQSYVRWFLAFMAMFLLVRVSVLCLLASLLSYMWFLAVLAAYGLRSSRAWKPEDTQARPSA